MMKRNKFYTSLILLLLFAYCKQKKTDCIIREWKVIDVYRNSYPPIIDTICNDSFVLFNKQEISKRFLDSVFINIQDNKIFTLDTLGTYEVIANTSLENNGLKYNVAKVRYLAKGYNVDQEVLLWVVKDKGVYIQQENDHKKLFLLHQIKNVKGKTENTERLVEQIMNDTTLFPLPPPLPV